MDMLLGAGHRQCSFATIDLEGDEPIPGAPFDLVHARLLLLHVSDPVAVLRRLWAAVAPGGHLVIHDYDLSVVDTLPPLETMDEWKRVVLGAFSGAGCDIRIGTRLPLLFAEAGLGAPDGTDVAGRLEALGTAGTMLAAVFDSMLPAALSMGLTTPDEADRWRDAFAHDQRVHRQRPGLWPLLVGAWKGKAGR
jgi:SAM-dependent methyltransferase